MRQIYNAFYKQNLYLHQQQLYKFVKATPLIDTFRCLETARTAKKFYSSEESPQPRISKNLIHNDTTEFL